ncbi:MAG: hypothetical protein LBT19_02830 [Candidatus Nomurabacteria bacterium]|jgi:hypothetical protein|nr:hypothetical protein [Candidatus Nomurabacteria bacterium]
MKLDISQLSIDELWELYGETFDKLSQIGEIRSKNITGDRGEQLAIKHYCDTKGLPKLQMTPPSTKNIDAISTQGERYSIKTVTLPNKTTGVFHGYGTPEKPLRDKKFEYLIVVVLNKYQPELIIELLWEDFYELKRWHSTMAAFNITLTKAVLEKAKTIYRAIKTK